MYPHPVGQRSSSPNSVAASALTAGRGFCLTGRLCSLSHRRRMEPTKTATSRPLSSIPARGKSCIEAGRFHATFLPGLPGLPVVCSSREGPRFLLSPSMPINSRCSGSQPRFWRVSARPSSTDPRSMLFRLEARWSTLAADHSGRSFPLPGSWLKKPRSGVDPMR